MKTNLKIIIKNKTLRFVPLALFCAGFWSVREASCVGPVGTTVLIGLPILWNLSFNSMAPVRIGWKKSLSKGITKKLQRVTGLNDLSEIGIVPEEDSKTIDNQEYTYRGYILSTGIFAFLALKNGWIKLIYYKIIKPENS